jgi:hypothetical protein
VPIHEHDVKWHYQQVLHYAYLHDRGDLETINIKSIQFARLEEKGGPSTPILLVTSPRWCPDCVKERIEFLHLIAQHRLVKIEGIGQERRRSGSFEGVCNWSYYRTD